jgi:hypothetical protein
VPDMPQGSGSSLLLRSVFSPLGLIVLGLTAAGLLAHANVLLLPVGLLIYANIVVFTYFAHVKRTTGVNLAANPTVPLAPQYRAWTQRAAQASEALQDMVLQADPTVKPLLEPISLRAREMAAKLDALATEANRMYRYLLEADPNAAAASPGDASLQLRLQSRQTIVASHEQVVAAAESILAGMDGVRAQAMRVAMGGVTGEDGVLAQAVQKLDEMRATADAVEEVVARTRGQVTVA